MRRLNHFYYHHVYMADDCRHRYRAARIVYRTLLVWRSQRRMLLEFATRCMLCPAYRDMYVYIHETDEPHVCLREWPVWLQCNVYREQMLDVLPSHILERMSQHLNNALLNVNI